MDEQEGTDALADDRQPDYLSYLLRLWRVGRGQEACWRASLQRPGVEEPLWFAGIEEMFAFLRAETGKAENG